MGQRDAHIHRRERGAPGPPSASASLCLADALTPVSDSGSSVVWPYGYGRGKCLDIMDGAAVHIHTI